VVCSFIGYQTRGAAPSNFDINYAYNLGFAATRLIIGGFSGYMASIGNLKAPVAEWQPLGVPITALMISETQGQSPVVPKTIVDLNGPSFAALKEMRLTCSVSTPYRVRSYHTCSWL
jgi:6-phosphofructokinase